MLMERLLFDRRARRVCVAGWFVAWFVAAAGLLLPLGISTPDRSDLVIHFMLFASLAFSAIGFSRRPGQLTGLALATIALATTLEFAQKLVPYRTFDLVDAAANGLGASAGYGAALLVLFLVIRPAELRWSGAAS
jgi:VanZ family protein